jgi:hypothetical protein
MKTHLYCCSEPETREAFGAMVPGPLQFPFLLIDSRITFAIKIMTRRPEASKLSSLKKRNTRF